MKKIIIVTGDSRGLGKRIVEKLLDEKFDNLILGISRSVDTSIKSDNYIHISYDLSDCDNIKNLYLNKIKPLGKIQGLIYNSAIAYDDIITNLNIATLIEMYEINVFSAMALAKYAIRDMLLNKVNGSLVFISSICAHTGYKGLSMYASTKAAIEAFSKTIAREWGEVGIRSNCVAPGFMETDMSQNLDQNQKKRIYARTALKMPTDIDSVAEATLFLISEKAKSITGQVIIVDNGTI